MGPVLANAPDELLQSLANGLSWWLQTIAKGLDTHEKVFLELCKRILALDFQDSGDNEDPLFDTLNHPIGQVTEALLRWWYLQPLEDGQGLPAELKHILTNICDTRIEKYRKGRLLLCAHVISLFRVDKEWATLHLLPLFDWSRSMTEARSAWWGYLWSPRLYRPLMVAIKEPFLAASMHYTSLGKYAQQYASLLTFAALDPGDTFTMAELSGATHQLPAEGLANAARSLVRELEGAGEQRSDYWKNRILPYLRSIWPKSKNNITPEITNSLARLCIEARDEFPDALDVLKHWLRPAEHPHSLVHQLNLSGLCKRFPSAALTYLDLVISDDAQLIPTDLKDCMTDIKTTDPKLTTDSRFQRLMTYLRRHGYDDQV